MIFEIRSASTRPRALLLLLQHLGHSPPADAVPGFQQTDLVLTEFGALLLRLEDAEAGGPPSGAADRGERGVARLRAVAQGEDLVKGGGDGLGGGGEGGRAVEGGGGGDARGGRRAGIAGEGALVVGAGTERVGEHGSGVHEGWGAGRHFDDVAVVVVGTRDVLRGGCRQGGDIIMETSDE